MNGQGAPTNWTGKAGNFYEIATYPSGNAQWLESFFAKPGRAQQCYRGATRQGGQWVQPQRP